MSTNTAIKTWQERRSEYYGVGGSIRIRSDGYFKCAEIAELRAALEAVQPAAQQGALDIIDMAQARRVIMQLRSAIAQRAGSGEAEPVAYLRFRAAQSWSGNGNHDVESSEWLEICDAHEIGDDKLPAFPVYTSMRPDSERDAARYRKARQGAYRLAVGNPTPEEFDAAVDSFAMVVQQDESGVKP